MRILIAEDDEETAGYIERGLSDLGHSVVRADNGQDALDTGTSEHFDMIVLDRMMPRLEGLDVLRRLPYEDNVKWLADTGYQAVDPPVNEPNAGAIARKHGLEPGCANVGGGAVGTTDEAQQAKVRSEHEAKAAQLKEAVVSIVRKVGAENKMFGSVSSKDISEALAAQNVEIDRKLIKLDEPIKQIGEHTVEVRFSSDVSVSLKVQVIGVPA